MDVTKPAIQIFYGKYLDAITNEIPADHIPVEKNGPFQITLEPGKPNFPTNDSATITLANLDADGAELYPKQWFIDESKSEAEGAVYPFELFFRVYTYGEAAFTGIYGEKKYSVNNDEVTISLNSIVGLLDKKDPALKAFKFSQLEVVDANSTGGDYALGTGQSLDAENLNVHALLMPFHVTGWESEIGGAAALKAEFNNHKLLQYLGYEFDDFPEIGDSGTALLPPDNGTTSRTDEYGFFTAYVKIKEITLLTRVTIFVKEYLRDTNPDDISITRDRKERIYLKIWHANNSNYLDDEITILQRGKYFNNEQGDTISSGDKLDVTLFLADRASNESLLKAADLNFSEALVIANDQGWVHGVRWAFTSGTDWEVLESELNRDYFDVFKLTLDSISRFYKSFYNNSINADFFDLTNAGTTGRKAFIADALMFNWIGEKNTTKDLIVSLAQQTNCYLYADAMGKIVYQSRSLHEDDYASETTPLSAVDLDSSDYFFNSGQTEDFGFDTFEIEVPVDIVEINNLVSDQEQLIYVDANGEADQPGLRNTDLELSGFRIYDLAVPQTEFVDNFPVWRLSPSDPSFPGYTADLMNEFLQHPVALAAAYAKRFVWPTEFIYPKLPGQHYPSVKEGGLMYRDKDGVRTIYLVTRIDRSAEMFKTIELKKEAEWEVV